MFSKHKKITQTGNSQDMDIKSYIDSGDIYNSKLLYMIQKLQSIGVYTIPKIYEKRIDLISKDLYKNLYMSEILLIYNGIKIDELLEGVKLRVPTEKDINLLKTKVSIIKCPNVYLFKDRS